MTDYHASYAEGKPPAVPCPVCNAPPDLRVWQKYTNSQYHTLASVQHPFIGSEVVPLVCTSCGYVQLFVNPKDFRK